MTGSHRPLRDILAETMRRERYPFMTPRWADWSGEGQEQMRRRADHLMRLLSGLGVGLVHTGEEVEPPPPPDSLTIWRFKLHGRDAERLIRKAAGDDWQMLTVDGGVETVELTTTIAEMHDHGGLVLTEHPGMKAIPGIVRKLAMLNEIYRVRAEEMRGPG